MTNGDDMWERICLAPRHQTNSETLYCFCLDFILLCGKGPIITICDIDKIRNWNWTKRQILDGNSWNIQRVFRNGFLVNFIIEGWKESKPRHIKTWRDRQKYCYGVQEIHFFKETLIKVNLYTLNFI